MSNANFDLLDKRCELIDARQSLRTWEASRARTDLTDADIEFLDRAIQGAREWIARAESNLRCLHT